MSSNFTSAQITASTADRPAGNIINGGNRRQSGFNWRLGFCSVCDFSFGEVKPCHDRRGIWHASARAYWVARTRCAGR